MEAYSLSNKSDSLLRSVRKKSQGKAWKNNKVPVAPPMPTRPVKVYKVDPINFRDLVQQLTGAGAAAAPPPPPHQLKQRAAATTTSLELDVPRSTYNNNAPAASSPVSTNWYEELLQSDSEEPFGVKSHEAPGSLELNLSSPSSSSSYNNWMSSFPLMIMSQPGTMTSSLEPAGVL